MAQALVQGLAQALVQGLALGLVQGLALGLVQGLEQVLTLTGWRVLVLRQLHRHQERGCSSCICWPQRGAWGRCSC